LTLEHCANGFMRSGVAALFTMGGHHWIIEGNTVRHINLGHNIVRRNRISDCGTAGMRGQGAQVLVEDNDVVDCGWQDAESHWEVAGIKLLGCRGTLVRNNHVARIQAGDGIWLDFGNQNSRVWPIRTTPSSRTTSSRAFPKNWWRPRWPPIVP
jgi:hypothetical protein